MGGPTRHIRCIAVLLRPNQCRLTPRGSSRNATWSTRVDLHIHTHHSISTTAWNQRLWTAEHGSLRRFCNLFPRQQEENVFPDSFVEISSWKISLHREGRNSKARLFSDACTTGKSSRQISRNCGVCNNESELELSLFSSTSFLHRRWSIPKKQVVCGVQNTNPRASHAHGDAFTGVDQLWLSLVPHELPSTCCLHNNTHTPNTHCTRNRTGDAHA